MTLRTFIIDNGCEYSDHTVWFIETHLPVERVVEAVSLSGHTLDAVVEGPVDWREGRPSTYREWAASLYGSGLVWANILAEADALDGTAPPPKRGAR